MSRQEHTAMLHIVTCDFPGCTEEDERWSDIEAPRWAGGMMGWTSLDLADGPVALCPRHAKHKSLLRMVLDLIDRKTRDPVA